jgi:hypothetical protein
MANEQTIAGLQQVVAGYDTSIASVDKTDLQAKLAVADEELQVAQRKFNRLSGRLQGYRDWETARKAALDEIERLAGRVT